MDGKLTKNIITKKKLPALRPKSIKKAYETLSEAREFS